MSKDLATILFGLPYRLLKKVLKGPKVTTNYDENVGRYQINIGLILAIIQEDGSIASL